MKTVDRVPILVLGILLLTSGCTVLRTEPPTPTHSPANRTGVADLDRIIATALKQDVNELRSLIEFTETQCTFAVGMGGPPKCLPNEQEGARVQVLPLLGPEGQFIRKQDIQDWKGLSVSNLYAVYQVSDRAYSDKDYPAGEYALVFVGGEQNSTSVTLQARRGRIVRIDFSDGYPPRIRPEDVVRYLVPPTQTPAPVAQASVPAPPTPPATTAPLGTYTGPVKYLKFSPDSHTLASAETDGIVQLWAPMIAGTNPHCRRISAATRLR